MRLLTISIISIVVTICYSWASVDTQDFLETGWYEINYDGTGILMELDRADRAYQINPEPAFTSKDFSELYVYESKFGTEDSPTFGLAILLNEDLTSKWSDFTEKSIGKNIAFILDNKLIAAPKVNTRINYPTSAINRTEYSKAELEEFMRQIKKN